MQSSGSSSAATGSATTPGNPQARSRYPLHARSVRLDERVNAFRRDLADLRLADRVFAPHYAVAVRRSAGRSAPLLSAAGPGGEPRSTILPGEPFDLLEISATHGWGRSPIDGAAGFVPIDALVAQYAAAHIVRVVAAPLHARPDRGSSVLSTLPAGSRVAAAPVGDEWVEVDGGYLPSACVVGPEEGTGDIAAAAEAMTGVPETAGGRSGEGVDPAGLIFLAATIAGIGVPRFADLQAAAIGIAVAEGDTPRRGDLVFRGRHVAVLIDGESAVHVDGAVRREPATALDRLGPVTARRRIA